MRLIVMNLLIVHTIRFVMAYIVQMRPYLLFVSGMAGLVGISKATYFNPSFDKVWMAFIPLFLGYGFGQALTDCFQMDTDKISAPFRPLSKGLISVSSVLVTSLAGLMICGLLLLALHPYSFYLSVVVMLLVLSYSYLKRKSPVLGPVPNALAVSLLPLMGFYAGLGKDFHYTGIIAWELPVITFFSFANFVLMGNLKDISADEKTGYRTFPVVFGWNRTVIAGGILVTIALVVFWLTASRGLYQMLFGIAASIMLFGGILNAFLQKNKTEKHSIFSILMLLRGYIVLHIALILGYREEWLPMTVLLYVLFEAALYLRPSKVQV